MNLTASILRLDRSDIKALHITDPYSLHRVVYSLYKNVRSDMEILGSKTSGILYADQGGNFKERRILLLASREPTPCIEGKYGRVDSRPIPTDFLGHDKYRFKVIINPTRRNNTSRKLVSVKSRDAIAQWFLARAPQSWGFTAIAEHLQIDRLQVLQFKDKAQRPVTLAQAHVQGRLIVTDREQFHHSFTAGIGRGRAFGCGLLQIVPFIDNPFS